MPHFRKFILTCTLLMFACYGAHSKGKDNRAYIIDSSITHQVEQKVKMHYDNPWFSTDFRVYQEDTLIYDTYANGNISKSLALTEFLEDSIKIIVPELDAGFEYEIDLFNDTCIVKYSVHSNQASVTYRLSKNDDLQYRLHIPIKTYRLRLSKKPTFTKEEVFDGIIELTSENYYRAAGGEESKYRLELTGYFRKFAKVQLVQEAK